MPFNRVISTINGAPLSPQNSSFIDATHDIGFMGGSRGHIAGESRFTYFFATGSIWPLTNLSAPLPNDGIMRLFRYDGADGSLAVVLHPSGNPNYSPTGIECCSDETGDFVVFVYVLSGPGDTWFPNGVAGAGQIVAYRWSTNTMTLLSTSRGGTLPSFGNNRSPQCDPEGIVCGWISDAANLVDINLSGDPVARVSDASQPTQYLARNRFNGGRQDNIVNSTQVTFPRGGRYAYIDSDATNLQASPSVPAGDRTVQIYRIDLAGPGTADELVTRYAGTGLPFKGDPLLSTSVGLRKFGSHHQWITSDNDLLIFTCYCIPPVDASKSGYSSIIGIRFSTGAVTPLSVNAAGVQGDRVQADAHVSPDGTFLVCEDGSTNMDGVGDAYYPGIMYGRRWNLVTGAPPENLARLSDGTLPVPNIMCTNAAGQRYAGSIALPAGYTGGASVCPLDPGRAINGLRFLGSPRVGIGGRVTGNGDMRNGVFNAMLIEP